MLNLLDIRASWQREPVLAQLAQAACTALHTLQADGCDVLELPPGPYMQGARRWLSPLLTSPTCIGCAAASQPTRRARRHAGLQTLVLEGNRLAALPGCLTSATRLETLSLRKNSLTIGEAEVDGTLARMPALRTLRLSQGQLAPGAAARLAARLPRLRLELSRDAPPTAGQHGHAP